MPAASIKFYQTGQAYDIFSNVALGGFHFNLNGINYNRVNCVEAAYQGIKALTADPAENAGLDTKKTGYELLIRGQTGSVVQQAGTTIRNKRFIGEKDAPDSTLKEQLMHDLLLCKITQNPPMLKALLETKKLHLIEDTSQANYNDDFWGNGKENTGRNALGKLWMQVRQELQDELNRNGAIAIRVGLSPALAAAFGLSSEPFNSQAISELALYNTAAITCTTALPPGYTSTSTGTAVAPSTQTQLFANENELFDQAERESQTFKLDNQYANHTLHLIFEELKETLLKDRNSDTADENAYNNLQKIKNVLNENDYKHFAELIGQIKRTVVANNQTNNSSGNAAAEAVDKNILTVLREERARLFDKYGNSDSQNRISILDKLITEINCHTQAFQSKTIDASQLKAKLSTAIQTHLNDQSLDKYKSWAEKLGLILLNALLFIPLVTIAIKYAATGSCFFSLTGKTHEAALLANDHCNNLMLEPTQP